MNIERQFLVSLLSIKITFIYIIQGDEYYYASNVINLSKMYLVSFMAKCVPKVLL